MLEVVSMICRRRAEGRQCVVAPKDEQDCVVLGLDEAEGDQEGGEGIILVPWRLLEAI